MPNQDDWTNAGDTGLTYKLSFTSFDEDAVRQKNLPGQLQREVITDRGVRSPYKIQALLRTCIHGTLDKESSEPASLIVVDYRVQTAKENAMFSQMTTSFEFSAGNLEKLNPSVLAYGPFEEQMRWNQTDVTKSENSRQEVQICPEVAGTKVGGLMLSREKESEWIQRSFDRGLSTRHFDNNGRAHTVEWTLLANEKQNDGIPPCFRVAMLVERDGDGPFEAKFAFTAKGGLGYTLEALSNRFLRKTAIDDPIIFLPSKEPFGATLDGAFIDRYELRALSKEHKLIGLDKVWGLAPMSQASKQS